MQDTPQGRIACEGDASEQDHRLARVKRIRRRVTVILLCVAVVLLGCDLYRFTVRLPKKPGSLQRWLPTAGIIDSGEELYEKRPDYLYPPIFLIIIKPLANLTMPARAIVYQLAHQGSLILAVLLGWRIVRHVFGRVEPFLLVAGIVLTARFFESDLSHGNVNLFMLMLVMLALWLWQTDRGVLAGLSLALAISVKLTPALIAVYAAYKRQWALLAGTIVGLAVFLVLIRGAYLGWSKNLATLHAWASHVIVPFSTELDIVSLHHNQSLAGTLLRYLTSTLAMDRPVRDINMASLSPGQTTVIYRFCAAAILGFSLFGLRGRIDTKNTLRFIVHLSIVQLLMLLLSGYSWHAHFVYLFLPYMTLVIVWSRRDRGRVRTWLGVSIGATYVLASLMTSVAGPYWSDMFDSYGVVTASALILLVALVLLAPRSEEPAAAQGRRIDRFVADG